MAAPSVRLAVSVSLLLATAMPAAAQEDCSTALPIALGIPAADNTTGAVDDYDPGNFGCTGFPAVGPDHVYTFTSAGELVDVVLTPLASDYDPSLWLFTNCADPAGSCAKGADRHGAGATEKIEFLQLVNGTTYYLVVDGYDDAFVPWNPFGPYRLDLRQSVIPEDCPSARTVPYLPWFDSLDSSLGVHDLDPPGCLGGSMPGPDLVYRIDPTYAATLEVELQPFGFDAAIYAVTGCPGACLAGADAGGLGATETMSVPLTPGTPVFVVVDGPAGGGQYDVTFRVGETCAQAVQVPSLPFSAEGDSSAASGDVTLTGFACTGFKSPGPDVVYALQSATAALVDVRLEPLDGAYDAALYAVTDCAQPDATCVDGADVGLDGEPEELKSLLLPAGQTVYVVVDSSIPFEGAAYQLRVDPSTSILLYMGKTAPGAADVKLEWLGDAAPYDLYRDPDPLFPGPPIQTGLPGPSHVDTPPAGSFYYAIR